MSIYEQIVWATIVIVFVVDLSGFTQSWKAWLEKRTHYRIGSVKPFDCSLCLSWWIGLLLVYIAGFDLRTLAFVCLCSLLTKPLRLIVQLALDLLGGLVELIYKLTKI